MYLGRQGVWIYTDEGDNDVWGQEKGLGDYNPRWVFIQKKSKNRSTQTS